MKKALILSFKLYLLLKVDQIYELKIQKTSQKKVQMQQLKFKIMSKMYKYLMINQQNIQSKNTVDMIVQKKYKSIELVQVLVHFNKQLKHTQSDLFLSHQVIVDLQKNLIISHTSCFLESIKPNIVLIIMIWRLNCLIRSFSGVRMSLIESLYQAIVRKLIPKVLCQGSVEVSKDSALLSHQD